MAGFDIKASEVPVATANAIMPAKDYGLGAVEGLTSFAAQVFGAKQKEQAQQQKALLEQQERDFFGSVSRDLERVYSSIGQGGKSSLQAKVELDLVYRKAVVSAAEQGYDVDDLKKIGAQFGASGTALLEEAEDERESVRENEQKIANEAANLNLTVDQYKAREREIADIDLELKRLQLMQSRAKDATDSDKADAVRTLQGFAFKGTTFGINGIRDAVSKGFDPKTATPDQKKAGVLAVDTYASQLRAQVIQFQAAYPDAKVENVLQYIDGQAQLAKQFYEGTLDLNVLENANKIAATSFQNNMPEDAKRATFLANTAPNNPFFQKAAADFLSQRPEIFKSIMAYTGTPTDSGTPPQPTMSTGQVVSQLSPEDKKKYQAAASSSISSLMNGKEEEKQIGAQMFTAVVDPIAKTIDPTNVKTMRDIVLDDKAWGQLEGRVPTEVLNEGAMKLSQYSETLAEAFNRWKSGIDKTWGGEWYGGVKSKVEQPIDRYIEAVVDNGQLSIKISDTFYQEKKANKSLALRETQLLREVSNLQNGFVKEANKTIKALARLSGMKESDAAQVITSKLPSLQEGTATMKTEVMKEATPGVPELLKRPEEPKTSAISEDDQELLDILRSLSPEERLLLKTGVA